MEFFEFNILTQNAFNKYNGNFELSANDEKINTVFKKLITIFDENNDKKLSGEEIQKIWKETRKANLNPDIILDELETKAYIKKNKDKFVSSELKFNGFFFEQNKTLISAKELISFLNYIYDSIGESVNGKENFVPTTLPVKDQYSLENLKKKFPEKYCEIEHTGPYMIEGGDYSDGKFSVRYKKNYKILVYGYLDKSEPHIGYDGKKHSVDIYFDTKDDIALMEYAFKKGSTRKYITVKNGEIYKTTSNDSVTSRTKFPIVNKIYKILNNTNNFGVKQIDVKALDNLLDTISADDFKEILLQDNYKTNFLVKIENEPSIDKKTKEKLLKRFNAFIANDERIYNEYGRRIITANTLPNCKIDSKYNQGSMGDCWFLATIAAINAKPEGAKLLNNMITKQEDGSYKVKFLGAKKSYTVTPIEIYTNKDLAGGDLDVRILEIAAKKHFYIKGIHGGNPSTALELILGTYDKPLNGLRICNPIANTEEELKEVIKDPNTAVTTGISWLTKFGLYKFDIDDFNTFIKKYNPLENFEIAKDSLDYASRHAYAVVDIDDEFVYIQNPHWVKSSKKEEQEKDIKVPIDLFQRIFHNIQYSKIPSEYITPPIQ